MNHREFSRPTTVIVSYSKNKQKGKFFFLPDGSRRRRCRRSSRGGGATVFFPLSASAYNHFCPVRCTHT